MNLARSTPVPELDPRDPEELRENLSAYQKHGTRGARDPGETVAEELERKGAIYDGDFVSVLNAFTFGVDPDGYLQGEAEITHSQFEDPVTVSYIDLELPSDQTVKTLGPDLTKSLPAYYAEELTRREAVIDACPIDIYCSSINPAWGWPHKLMSYYEARPGAAESCETLIIDSGFNRWGSPDDVLAAAAKTDATYVMATDVTGLEDPEKRDHNSAMPSTDDPGIETQQDAALEGIQRFMERADELGIDHRVILPLQPPYDDFMDACERRGWLDRVDYVSVGGLLTINDVQDRIKALHTVRDRLGDDYKIHALAPGRDPAMMAELQDHPDLIDSLDNSTPEQAPGNDKIPDASGEQTRHFFPRGTHASTLRGAASVMVALETAQMLSPLCNAEDTYGEVLDSYDDEEEAEPASEDPQREIQDWANDDAGDALSAAATSD